MSNTTKENVQLIAPEFASGVPDALFDLILADVALEVSSAGYGAKQEVAQRWLAAHYLTITLGSGGTGGASNSGIVTKEKVGDVEFNYADTVKSTLSNLKNASRFDETKYGRTFENINKTAIIPFKVIKP